MPQYPMPDAEILSLIRKGLVIPAHPLALTAERKLDERRQRGLTRYYLAAGAGGVAIGVHTTQFAIRDPKIGLHKPVLELAAHTVAAFEKRTGKRIVRVAGICGPTAQAVKEAELASSLGYHAGLLSLAAMKEADDAELIEHSRAIAKNIPIVGFYLQPSVGGRLLSFNFWRRFAEIPNVVAIKISPFNRYQTLDVMRAVAEANRDDIAMYTGNDDNIVLDLLTTNRFKVGDRHVNLRIVGGLLGHWAVWTKRAVELLDQCHAAAESRAVPAEMLTRAIEVTDCNAAFFDAATNYAGCIPGIHEPLARQGLLAGRWTLDPKVDLSPGQEDEIDRIHAAYPHLNDDAFVAEHRDDWLR